MTQRRFTLTPVLEARRQQRDACRQRLAAAQVAERRLTDECERLAAMRAEQIEELRDLTSVAALDVQRSAARRRFAAQVADEMHLAEATRLGAAAIVATRRAELVTADQAVRALEKLAEKEAAASQAALDRQTARELEEAWRPD